MSLTLDLDPKTEAALRAEAERTGVEPEQLVAALVKQRFEASTPRSTGRTQEDWMREVRAWADSHDRSIPPLSDAAVSRQSFYEDRL